MRVRLDAPHYTCYRIVVVVAIYATEIRRNHIRFTSIKEYICTKIDVIIGLRFGIEVYHTI